MRTLALWVIVLVLVGGFSFYFVKNNERVEALNEVKNRKDRCAEAKYDRSFDPGGHFTYIPSYCY